MPANITYSLPSSEITLWATRAEAVVFFDGLTVPSAALATEGVVKKATSVSYTVISAYDESGFFSLQLGEVEEQIPQLATFEEVRTKLQALSVSHNALLVALRNAGIIDN